METIKFSLHIIGHELQIKLLINNSKILNYKFLLMDARLSEVQVDVAKLELTDTVIKTKLGGTFE